MQSPFAISIFKLEWFEVNEQELGKGFSGGSYASISRCRVQSPQSRRHFPPVREGALAEPAALQLGQSVLARATEESCSRAGRYGAQAP